MKSKYKDYEVFKEKCEAQASIIKDSQKFTDENKWYLIKQ